MTLQILGASHDQAALYFQTDGDDYTYITPDELATIRSVVASRGVLPFVLFFGNTLDESDVTTLIEAFNQPQPLYPLEPCRHCGTDATDRIDGAYYCNGHAQGYAIAEQERAS